MKLYENLLTIENMAYESIKGSTLWFRDLEAYCQKLEYDSISVKTVYLNPRQFVEGIRDGKLGVFDETAGRRADPGELVCLLERDAIERYIRQNPAVSIQSKINMLNARLRSKIKEEFLGKGIKYSEAERKAILKAYRGFFGGRIWRRSVFELYNDFLLGQNAKGYNIDIPNTEFDVYDLAALAYLYKRVKETDVISEAHHIVIDEAQDFGMMAYLVLKFCIYRCTYTIMGDISQNIHFGYGLNDWKELKELFLTDPMDSFGILKKSYRNTVEISDFATNILHHGRFSIYPVEPIIRHGNPVRVEQIADEKDMIHAAADICKKWQSGNGHAKLLYVAATRALHELCVLHTGNLTGLIADPVSHRVSAEEKVSVSHSQLNRKQPKAAATKKQAVISQKAKAKPVALRTQNGSEQRELNRQKATAYSDAGHGRIDLAVRWVARQQDGIYLHSRYGVLRLSPIGSAIVRVTFAKGGRILDNCGGGQPRYQL